MLRAVSPVAFHLGDFEFSLGGEVDKEWNPHFRGGPYARAEPDLLVHRFGDMERNLAIVEVKSTNGLGGTAGDLSKLLWFCDNAQYFRGIFLVYGDAGEDAHLFQRVRASGVKVSIDFKRVKCLYHRRIGEKAQLLWR